MARGIASPNYYQVLLASAARTVTAGTNGTAAVVPTNTRKAFLLLDATVAVTDSGDLLDAYIDVSPDGTTYVNAVRFTQVVGGAGAKKYWAVLDSNTPGTAVIAVTTDCAQSVVRPQLWGAMIRPRWVITDTGGNASFTFSIGVLWC